MIKSTLFFRLFTTKPFNLQNKNIIEQCGISVPQLQVITSKNNTDEEIDIESEIKSIKLAEKESILSSCNEDISHIAPYFRPTFNLAAYINKSDTLKKLVELGTDLHRIEKRKLAPELILKLDFEKDVKPYLFLLHDLGVTPEQLGPWITKNPFIFQQDLDDLKVRLNYLEAKKFNKDMITRIVTKNPFWLMFSTQRIDNRLGHFQHNFGLTGAEIRALSTKQPKIITYNMDHIKLNTFSVKEEMGFNKEQTKELLLQLPKIWMMSQDSVLNRFDFIHNTMEISHEQILKMPKIFTSRKFRIEQRHKFLVKLGRAQYDPMKENFVSLEKLIVGSDSDFCLNIAKSSVQAYNVFLKTL